MRWAEQQVATHASDPYWATVGAIFAQLDGITAGYNAAAPSAQQLTPQEMLIQNLDGDMESLHSAVLGGLTQTQRVALLSLYLSHIIDTVSDAETDALEEDADANAHANKAKGKLWNTSSFACSLYDTR